MVAFAESIPEAPHAKIIPLSLGLKGPNVKVVNSNSESTLVSRPSASGVPSKITKPVAIRAYSDLNTINRLFSASLGRDDVHVNVTLSPTFPSSSVVEIVRPKMVMIIIVSH